MKFIRFSQWRIQQTGMGILAFITNHGYLDKTTSVISGVICQKYSQIGDGYN